jgi:hypothetical protein
VRSSLDFLALNSPLFFDTSVTIYFYETARFAAACALHNVNPGRDGSVLLHRYPPRDTPHTRTSVRAGMTIAFDFVSSMSCTRQWAPKERLVFASLDTLDSARRFCSQAILVCIFLC